MAGKVTKTHQIAYFMESNNKQKAEIEALNKRVNGLDNENIELREKNATQEETIKELMKKTEGMEHVLSNQTQDLNDLSAKIRELTIKNTRSLSANKDLHGIIKELHEKHDSITSSFWGKLALKRYNKEHKE